MLDSFKPTLNFLIRFIVIYGVGSFLYSLYIADYDPKPDGVTKLVANQMAWIMNAFSQNVDLYEVETNPYVGVMYNKTQSVSVFEGCNGLAVMILFAAFVFAFRGKNNMAAVWFVPLGFFFIHLFNMLRLSLLIVINFYYTNAFHFYHKFVFTGIIYAFVLFLWIWWVQIQKQTPKSELTIDEN